MDIRAAEPHDKGRIRDIAEQSFQTSYSLSPGQIETIVKEVFSDKQLADWIERNSECLLLAEEEDDSIGFANVKFGDQANLLWLHVEPGYRGQGAGTELFDRVQTEAENRNLPLLARVLTEGEEGERFCEQFGFERSAKTKLEFAEETFFGYIYRKPGMAEFEDYGSAIEIPETITADGTKLHIARDDETPGTDGPFFRTYKDQEGVIYGFYCSNCESMNVESDSLGRLECQNCGNKHLADQWDAAYF